MLPLLRVREVTVERDGVRLLDRLSLEIALGEHVAILGPNGAGKTSLLKLLLRQLYPSIVLEGQGSIEVLGRDVWNIWEMRCGFGVVSPELDRSFPLAAAVSMSVFDAVITGFFGSQLAVPESAVSLEMRDRAESCLAVAEVSSLACRKIDSLSTGELRRVMIARALVHEPQSLILDEPTTGLDLAGRYQLLRLLRTLAGQGVGMLLVTHHVEEILPEIEHMVFIKNGRVLKEGAKNDCLTADELSQLFEFPLQVTLEPSGFYNVKPGLGPDPL